MKIFNSKKIFLLSVLSLAFFVFDRVLKILSLHGQIFFYKNYGLSFSISMPESLFLCFYIFSFLILLIIVWRFFKIIKNSSNYQLLITSYQLLFLGIFSNLLDRLKYGFVIDYFNFYFFYNNLADIMLIVGAILIGYKYLKKNKKNPS